MRAPARRCRSKCNEALSRDLWPLDPFESAPMRATSSGICNSILCAITERMKIKDLAELLSGKAGRNSLPLKKLPCGFFLGRSSCEYYLAAMVPWLYSTNRYKAITRKMKSRAPTGDANSLPGRSRLTKSQLTNIPANYNIKKEIPHVTF